MKALMFPAILALGLAGAYAAEPQDHSAHHANTPTAAVQSSASQRMTQRFAQMQAMMVQVQSARGGDRVKLMQQHMQLMKDQMQAMMSSTSASNDPGQTQARMDMMQRMMEQMLNHQSMMSMMMSGGMVGGGNMMGGNANPPSVPESNAQPKN